MLALPLLALTLAGVVTRPRGVREWVVAITGAALVILLGVVPPADALAAIVAQWNVFLFFLGLMAISAIADQSGLLRHLVVASARAARGRADLLFVLVSGVAVLVTVTLSNDATVLLLTPLVVDMARRLRVPVLPYAFACAYLANAASIAIPIANPANVLVLQSIPLTASVFVALLGPSAVFATLATIGAVWWLRRGDLRGRIAVPPLTDHDAGARGVAVGIALIVVVYVVALELRWPVGIVAVIGGAALVALQAARGHLRHAQLRADIAWGIFPLLAGLVVVLRGAEAAGLVDVVAGPLATAVPDARGIAGVAVLSTLVANAMNNLPWALLAGAAAGHVATLDPRLAASLLVGIDVGPSFTAIGSLATILWLLLLRRRDIHVSALDYARASVIPSALALAAALVPLLVLAR
ncbi:MAG TPA: SLC13 family permease [Candidatus Limnocylindria bacterium]